MLASRAKLSPQRLGATTCSAAHALRAAYASLGVHKCSAQFNQRRFCLLFRTVIQRKLCTSVAAPPKSPRHSSLVTPLAEARRSSRQRRLIEWDAESFRRARKSWSAALTCGARSTCPLGLFVAFLLFAVVGRRKLLDILFTSNGFTPRRKHHIAAIQRRHKL